MNDRVSDGVDVAEGAQHPAPEDDRHVRKPALDGSSGHDASRSSCSVDGWRIGVGHEAADVGGSVVVELKRHKQVNSKPCLLSLALSSLG